MLPLVPVEAGSLSYALCSPGLGGNNLDHQLEGEPTVKAFYTNGTLIIREGVHQLAAQPVFTENPRDLVDRANWRLRSVQVFGNSSKSWQVRQTIAENLIGELTA